MRSEDGAYQRDMVSLEMNVLSGKLSKMHLTFYTNSEDAESRASPHTFSAYLFAAFSVLIDRAGQAIPYCLHSFPVRLV